MRRSIAKSRLARSASSVLEALEQRMLFNAATLVKSDSTTSGTWTGKYGADGYDVIGGNVSLPSYASVTVAGQQFHEWEAPGTSDARALQVSPGSATRVAACDYSYSSFTVDVNVTDGQTHQISLYLLDEDNLNRGETITVTDPATNTVLSTSDVRLFQNGTYMTYDVSGHVQFTLTDDPKSLNAVLSGIFFDPGPGGSGGGGGTTSVPAAASYVGTDPSTGGNWTGKYGSAGYSVVGGVTSLPSDISYNLNNALFHEWNADGTNYPGALQDEAGSNSHVSACYYSYSSFAININSSDAQTHQVALYLLDEDDFETRNETIQILDPKTDMVLASQNFANFQKGVYAVFNITGSVQVNVINGANSLNAVVSGIFFDGGSGSGTGTGNGPTTLTVGTGKEFGTIQAAVNASHSGDTVDVYSGTYKEQVVIPPSLSNFTLEAAKGQTVYVEPPTGSMTSTGAIIEDNGGNNDIIQGFNVMGPESTPGALRFGILIDGGATNVTVYDNNVSNIGDSNFSGFGGNGTGPTANNGIGIALTDGSATISNNIITTYQKAGILVGLSPEVSGSPTWIQTGTVENNNITGVGANTQVTQYGIEYVGLRATGTALANHVVGNVFSGPDTTGNAGGILVYNAGAVTVQGNVVYNNDTNIIIDGGLDSKGKPLGGSNFSIVASNQTFNAVAFDGIDLVDGVSEVTVQWNYSYNNAVDGIFIDGNSGGNTIKNNLVIDNKNYDIEDVTYSPSNYQGSPVYGTFNFYFNDQFGSSNDPNLPSSSYFGF